jgi:isochorismate pyruvate lyase
MSDLPEPRRCRNMIDVRNAVDEIDRRLVDLIALRFRFMDAAARIKTDRRSVRDEARKADVLEKVDSAAARLDVDRSLIARIYEDLIESSIAHELSEFDRLGTG